MGVNKRQTPTRPWKHTVMKQRRADAEARQVAYDKLTVEQKLARLDAGNFVATKQRARLEAQLKEKNNGKTST